MADPWSEFKPASGGKDEWSEFKPAKSGPKAKSQALGFVDGLLTPYARLERRVQKGLDKAYDALPIPEGAARDFLRPSNLDRRLTIGGQNGAEAEKSFQAWIDGQEKAPGEVGRAVGGAAASIPVATVVSNPIAAGALGGALTSDAEDLGGIAGDAALGAVLGKVGDVVLGKAADVVKPVLRDGVEMLNKAGVKLTPGQVKGGKALKREDRLMSRPFVGDKISEAREAAAEAFNVGALNKSLEGFGIKVPDGVRSGHDAVDWAHRAVSDAYESIAPKLTFAPDNRLGATIRILARKAQDLPDAEQRAFTGAIKRTFGKNGSISGRAVKLAQSDLSNKAKSFSSSTDTYQKELGGLLRDYADEFANALERQNPAVGQQLRAANKAFRGLAVVEDAAGRTPGGNFTGAGLRTAARRADSSARKNATARGNAFMQDYAKAGEAVLGGKTPNSGTAERSTNIVANVLGAVDSLGYNVDNFLTQLQLAPRPPGANVVANGLRQLGRRQGAGVGAGAVSAKQKR